ncbi:lipoprotein insertase outer membrane protein LolB [Shewanella sp. JM162201]|uniref:Outer-membrane lipoprotein LolB n=1 Tax=Shewanella jiangmenensis TaxID=2837387 RepID=A0ABS5V2H6_9GAMM|nr:lipoprotein insertase outer membrane protein LolB [Shewanella jiangmenensis]MBT1444652.1 lipoprotein insertase outer membrane protein LolB [Shewanella jiangmenensis]
MINLRRLTKFTLAALFGLSMLSGCTSTPAPTLYPAVVQSAAEASAWELKGKLLIHSGDDKLTANLYWLKSPDYQELRLSSMLGTTVLLLIETPKGATLELDGNSYQDSSAQALLDAMSTFPLPLKSLPLWITGQTMADDRVEWDSEGRPAHIYSHDGLWHIRIASWQQQSGALVPKLLELIHPKARLKLQTHQWQALTNTGASKSSSNLGATTGVQP